MMLTIHIDGGARGNPGPAGAGVSICDADARPLFEAGYWLGHMTNNMAEYQALLHALEVARELPDVTIAVFSDSELMVRQINGEYRVKNANIRGFYETAVERLADFKRWKITHVRREQNQRADELANMAMDRRGNLVLIDTLQDTGPTLKEPPSPPASSRAKNVKRKTRITARCTQAPKDGACPCKKIQDREFTFTDTVPAGVCLHVAGALIEAVLQLQAQDRTEVITVRCGKPGCDAVFSVFIK